MKKIFLLLFTFLSVTVYAQDTVTFNYVIDRGWGGPNLPNIPAYKVDGVRAAVIGPDTLWNQGNGSWTIRNGGVYGTGSSSIAATRLNALLSLPFISQLGMTYDTATVVTLSGSNINAHGKKLVISRGSRFAGSITIDSLYADISGNDYVFDTSLVFTNLRTTSGYLTPLNFGAPTDGTTNALRFIHNSGKVAAQNGMWLNCYGMYFYINNPIPLVPKLKIKGGDFTILRGGRFTQNFTRMDSLQFEDMKITMTGAPGLNSAYIFDLRSETGNKSVGLVMKNVRVEANRVNYYVIRTGNHSSSLIDGVYINNSNSIAIMVDSSDATTIQNCRLYNNGRSAINIHSHNNNVIVTKNRAIGGTQYEDFPDGIIDVYGNYNDGIEISENYIELTNIIVNPSTGHRAFRIKGSKNVKLYNNIAKSYSENMSSFVDVSERFGVNNRNVEIYNNTFQAVTGLYNRGVFFAGNDGGLIFKNNTITIDSAVTATPNASAILTSYRTNTDTLYYADFTGNTFNYNGKSVYTLHNYVRLLSANLSGTTALNTPQVFCSISENFVRDLEWIGGTISTSSNNPYFFVLPTFRSMILSGLIINRPNIRWLNRSGNDTAVVVSTGNTVNGKRAYADAGGIYGYPGTSAAATYNMGDSITVFTGTRTSEQIVTFPSKEGFAGSFRYLTQTGAGGYILINGDTIRTGKGALYYTANGLTYTKLLDNFNTGGGASGPTTLTGAVTGTGTGTVATTLSNNIVGTANVIDNAITYAKFQQGVARSILARSANSTGNYSALQSAIANQILYDNGTSLVFGNPPIPYSTVTNVPNYYFKNVSLGDTAFRKLNDTTFQWKSFTHPDTSVVKAGDSTINFKLQSARYAPSRSDPTNVASSSVESFMWDRSGSIISFSGTLRVTPTSASPATTALDLSLPLSPTFTLTTDLGASGSVTTPAVTGNSWVFLINGRTSNGTARVSFTSTGNTEHVIFITGKYELK